MGSCCSIIRSPGQERLTKSPHTYPRVCTVKIKNKELSSESSIVPFNFILTNPILLKFESVYLNSLEVVATECILPGIDPRGEYFKKCQDSCLFLHKDSSLFLGLFDGHGAEGYEIVNFCSLYAERYYLNNWKEPFVTII